jgi:hypothetical protein
VGKLGACVAIIYEAAASAHFDLDAALQVLDACSRSWLRDARVERKWERAYGEPKITKIRAPSGLSLLSDQTISPVRQTGDKVATTLDPSKRPRFLLLLIQPEKRKHTNPCAAEVFRGAHDHESFASVP